MTIILPENYHAQSLLEANRVTCIRREDAIRQDIRPMRIGILEPTPVDQRDELNLLEPLGLSIIQVDPVWIKLHSPTQNPSKEHPLGALYVSYEEAIKQVPLDGLIVHGTSLEQKGFEEFQDWEEMRTILLETRNQCPSTLGIGWGALVLAYLEGIATTPYPQPHFGVFEVENIYPFHPITGEMDDKFLCPQNCLLRINDAVLEQAKAEERFNLLAYGKESGYVIFETLDHRFVMHTGHPEYSSQKMLEEAQAGRQEAPQHLPVNFDLENPVSRWRGHRNSFFSYWLKYCYMCVSMQPHHG